MINIKLLRESKGYNSKEFANMLGISPSYYSQIEKNDRGLNFVFSEYKITILYRNSIKKNKKE